MNNFRSHKDFVTKIHLENNLHNFAFKARISYGHNALKQFHKTP